MTSVQVQYHTPAVSHLQGLLHCSCLLLAWEWTTLLMCVWVVGVVAVRNRQAAGESVP
jgi:hypothetical protein